MKYRPEIDGLRALAVMSVLLFHADIGPFPGGYIGVDVFFVISGYLITSIISQDVLSGKFSLAGFYERRVRRIIPALLLVILSCIPLAWIFMSPLELKNFSQSIVVSIFFSSNFLFWKEGGYFGGEAAEKPLLHTWSLSIEEQFYVIFPLIICLLIHRNTRTALLVTGAVLAGSLLLSIRGFPDYPEAAFFLLPARAWELMTGAVIALMLRGDRVAGGSGPRQVAAMAGLALIISSALLYDESIRYPGAHALAPVLGAALVIGFAGQDTPVGRILSARPLVGIGLISYSAYLWHFPLLAFARLATLHVPGLTTRVFLVAASLALGWLSWRYVEQPFRNRERMPRGTMLKWTGLAACLAVAIGVSGHVKDGFSGRLSPAERERAAELSSLTGAGYRHQGQGLTHFDTQVAGGVESFVRALDTRLGSMPAMRFAVVGDSHAADIAGGLRSLDEPVLQVTGPGCSLAPSRMDTTPYCRALMHYALEKISASKTVETIIMTNRFDDGEKDSMQEAFDFWSASGKEILFLTPRPIFFSSTSSFAKAFYQSRYMDDQGRDYSIQPTDLDEDDSRRVVIMDSREIFCSLTDDCSVMEGNDLLMVDGHHFSVLGAQRFVKSMLSRLEAREPPSGGGHAE